VVPRNAHDLRRGRHGVTTGVSTLAHAEEPLLDAKDRPAPH
jgi:hypothetical protein